MTSLQTIVVIGAGTMGTGIAQVCALGASLSDLRSPGALALHP
jgi:3-hydroxyacyl-CoA dehydrogenase